MLKLSFKIAFRVSAPSLQYLWSKIFFKNSKKKTNLIFIENVVEEVHLLLVAEHDPGRHAEYHQEEHVAQNRELEEQKLKIIKFLREKRKKIVT